MKIVGLIVEYNPFHNGHKLHLEKSKELTNADYSVAIMSGHFLQRGEPALFDKWTRAKIAVENGVDLVIELPSIYASQSAEYFSYGAIKILNSLNIIDSICFGSEDGDIELLKLVSKILFEENDDFKSILKTHVNQNNSYPKARQNALIEYIFNHEKYKNKYKKDVVLNLVSNPNNILGIEYIKALNKLKSDIKPFTITREKSDYNSSKLQGDICSATAIRESLKIDNNIEKLKDFIPKKTYENILEILKTKKPVFDDNFYDFIIYEIISQDKNIENIFEVKEGIENKILKEIKNSKNLKELLSNIKSKRYTYNTLKRILMNILLNIQRSDVRKIMNDSNYCRVLAFNNNGRKILKKLKKSSDIKIINKFKKDLINTNTSLNLDFKSTNIYNLIYNQNDYSYKDLLTSPLFIDNKIDK
ncbi:MAG: nucleotidyltransferase [Peptostreptococcaceae bacterium]|jgi:predicted nucleotidyltransferase|nr:nucleotidyltransferase [Peptostreptococcaceae bacterium]